MVEVNRHIPKAIKRTLIEEANGKCANPGCAGTRVQFHHIKHWAVCKAHNSEDMIAICPSCHDAAHNGLLRITDEMLYAWKSASRTEDFHHDQLFVEPSNCIKLLAGTIALATTNQSLIVFALSNHNTLAFGIEDDDIVLIRSRLKDLSGQQVLRVSDNRVKVQRDEDVSFTRRPGRVRIEVPSTNRYIYPEMLQQMRSVDPSFGANRIVALDLEVTAPGVVRVQGMWAAREGGVVITDQVMAFLTAGRPRPLCVAGEGEGSVLIFSGPITTAMFKVGF
jgi:HNH endonuclease